MPGIPANRDFLSKMQYSNLAEQKPKMFIVMGVALNINVRFRVQFWCFCYSYWTIASCSVFFFSFLFIYLYLLLLSEALWPGIFLACSSDRRAPCQQQTHRSALTWDLWRSRERKEVCFYPQGQLRQITYCIQGILDNTKWNSELPHQTTFLFLDLFHYQVHSHTLGCTCGTNMSRTRISLRGTLFTLPRNDAEGLQSAPTDLLSSSSYGLSLSTSLVDPNGSNGLEMISDHLQFMLPVQYGG